MNPFGIRDFYRADGPERIRPATRRHTMPGTNILILLTVAVLLVATPVHAGDNESVTFVVHCYDVGVQALENRPGVISVTRGWRGFREVDRVVYDPQQVKRGQLENWLREADTYVETIAEGKEN